MPREVIYCTPVWRAAAAPPEPGAVGRPEVREQEELRDAIPAEIHCGTTLRDGVHNEHPSQRLVSPELGHSWGKRQRSLTVGRADGSLKSRSVTKRCETHCTLRHEKAVRTIRGVNRSRENLHGVSYDGCKFC